MSRKNRSRGKKGGGRSGLLTGMRSGFRNVGMAAIGAKRGNSSDNKNTRSKKIWNYVQWAVVLALAALVLKRMGILTPP